MTASWAAGLYQPRPAAGQIPSVATAAAGALLTVTPQEQYDLEHAAIYRACLLLLGTINPCDQESHQERQKRREVSEGLVWLWDAINERRINAQEQAR